MNRIRELREEKKITQIRLSIELVYCIVDI